MKKIYDKNNTLIKDGDIVDVFDAICGEHLFVVRIVDDNIKCYYNFDRNRLYQYSVDELLEINEFEKEILVVGNIF